MPSIVVLAGSPSATSRTAAVLDLLALRLTGHGHDVRLVPIRELPRGPLLAADAHHPAIADVVEAVANARGLIVASQGGIHRAAQGLPRSTTAVRAGRKDRAAAGHWRYPGARAGRGLCATPRAGPMGAQVGQGYFVLDQLISVGPASGPTLAPAAERPLLSIVDAFSEAVASFRPVTVTV